MRALSGKTREKEKIIRRFPFVSLVGLVFFADRISKIFLSRSYSEGEGLSLIPGVFHLTMVHNTGAAFGLLRGESKILIVVSLAASLAILFFLRRPSWAWALEIGRAHV